MSQASTFLNLFFLFFLFRAIAQLVARDVRDVEVAGSNPVCPKNFSLLF